MKLCSACHFHCFIPCFTIYSLVPRLFFSLCVHRNGLRTRLALPWTKGREGYLLPTRVWKITCRCCNCMTAPVVFAIAMPLQLLCPGLFLHIPVVSLMTWLPLPTSSLKTQHPHNRYMLHNSYTLLHNIMYVSSPGTRPSLAPRLASEGLVPRLVK